MNALQLVNRLLETGVDVDNPETYLAPRLDDWDKYPLQMKVRDMPGGTRREGEGYSDQWDFVYNNWLFVVSTYEDGTQIWSAHYKAPAFSWSDPEERAQGWSWSGGGDPVKLPANYDPNVYMAKLKKMADENPNVWKARHVPHMPKP
jgi:hypothetical protein